ncbi:MAG TPA: hypothetical protein ENG27_01900 [Candidatus Bathyarchaeota archaeon]|nr:hypothetical protein [Candidatus Bathyarchaeota archaeon]
MYTTIRVRIETKKRLEALKQHRRESMDAVINRLIESWERAVEEASRLYKEGRVTLWRAAALAGLDLWEMIREMEKRGVELQCDY